MKFAYSKKITVVGILDSRGEAFRLKQPYADKVQVYSVITAPEIAMLVIISLDKYSAFKKSKKELYALKHCHLKFHNGIRKT